MKKKGVKIRRAIKNFYSFENYKPNKNAKPVVYNGTQYLSKAQCMALEGITKKELDQYLAKQENRLGNIRDINDNNSPDDAPDDFGDFLDDEDIPF